MKSTTQNLDGSSFYGSSITATVQDMIDALGTPYYYENKGDDKTNYEWECETENGHPVTIYDYKEYRSLEFDDLIKWHVGGFGLSQTQEAVDEISKIINS